jgi:hypothetical protein
MQEFVDGALISMEAILVGIMFLGCVYLIIQLYFK